MSDNTTILNDELPSPPAINGGAASGSPDASLMTPVDGTVSSNIFDLVTGQEPLPAGTYIFRLDEFRDYWSGKTPSADEDPFGFGVQPSFLLFNLCQQEPHVGHNFTEFVDWCTQAVFDAALNGPEGHPKTDAARKMVSKRIWRAKAIVEAAGYKPTGVFDIKEFFATHPEYKIQLKVTQKKEKAGLGPDGKMTYKDVPNSFNNNSVKYFPLNRPAA